MASIAPEIRTYRDALTDIMDFADTLNLSVDERRSRKAVKNGLRELGLARDWKYYRRIRQFDTVAPFEGESGATCSYDHAGGGYCERQLTLVPGDTEVWPDWTRDGEIKLTEAGTVLYPIAEHVNDTIAQLPEGRNPGEDVDAGTFAMHKMGYPVDGDIAKIFELNDEQGVWGGGYVSPDSWLQQLRSSLTTQETGFQWTLLGDDDSYGQMEFRLYGLPGSAQTIQFLAHCLPRLLRYTGYADAERSGTTATVAAVDGAQTITGTGTAFTSGMIGSVLRISSDGTEPDAELNPPAEQKIITAVASGTSLTVHSAVSDDYSGAGFVISDPIDVPKYLFALFEASCRMELAHLMDRHDRAKIEAAFSRALMQAQERDCMLSTPSMPKNWVSMKVPTFNRIVAAE